jgi:preprotein translocase subunit SecF
MSINQSLNRTVISSTALVTMVVMYLIGGKGLQDFSLALIIGIIVGTYSSSFVATPVAYEWIKRKGFKVKEEPTLKTTYRAVEPLPDR